METELLVPRISVGRVLGRGFRAYVSNFPLFVGVSAIAHIPYALLLLALLEGVFVYSPTLMVVFSAAAIIFESLVTLVLCRAAWDVGQGRKVSMRASWKAAAPRLLPGLGTAVVVAVGIVLGFFLLIIPGVIFLVVSWVALPVSLIERKGPFESVSRSIELLRGHGWTIFGIAFIYGLFDRVPDKVLESMANAGNLEVTTYLVLLLVLAVLVAPLHAMLVAFSYIDARSIHADKDIEAVASVFGDVPGAIHDSARGTTTSN